MRLWDGFWLPDDEQHLAPMAGDYQADKRAQALAHVKSWRTAVDVGAHCGLWSFHLLRKFQQVIAFEPVEEHRNCFHRNVPGAPRRWSLYGVALGAAPGMVAMERSGITSADCWVAGPGDVPMHRLDDYQIPELDFLKVDCAGGELEVLRGAVATLERWKPIVSVEQKEGKPTARGLPERGAVRFLEGMGAKVLNENGGVFVLGWA